jgi:(4-(4-[2-(gamma-L-glutamylamino)ethyl]phenoxymethyl)furan-2-yl)methanamine synthase
MNDATAKSNVVALDIGGANLKASDGREFHASRFFPLWKDPLGLTEALRALLATAPRVERYVATMTGELADCFRTKREGVAAICNAAADACEAGLQIYLTDGSFVSPDEAKRRYLEAAASNWHATATLVARNSPAATGILVDCGSTTCDVIPFAGGRVEPVGRTDTDRLASGELVYTGVVRSPVCALATQLPIGEAWAGVAQELFATALDVYLILGDLPEIAENRETADGRPATREYALERLARAICADRETFDLEAARRAAVVVEESQIRLIGAALRRVRDRQSSPTQVVYVCGQGEFLAREVLARIGWHGETRSFADEFGAIASRVGPAFALARLAWEVE